MGRGSQPLARRALDGQWAGENLNLNMRKNPKNKTLQLAFTGKAGGIAISAAP